MLDHKHPDGTQEFAILRKGGDLMKLGGDTIAFATKEQIVAMVMALEATPDFALPQTAAAIVSFIETLAE
jgi:hypothetical protein